jgi:hypothetical protein
MYCGYHKSIHKILTLTIGVLIGQKTCLSMDDIIYINASRLIHYKLVLSRFNLPVFVIDRF